MDNAIFLSQSITHDCFIYNRFWLCTEAKITKKLSSVIVQILMDIIVAKQRLLLVWALCVFANIYMPALTSRCSLRC